MSQSFKFSLPPWDNELHHFNTLRFLHEFWGFKTFRCLYIQFTIQGNGEVPVKLLCDTCQNNLKSSGASHCRQTTGYNERSWQWLLSIDHDIALCRRVSENDALGDFQLGKWGRELQTVSPWKKCFVQHAKNELLVGVQSWHWSTVFRLQIFFAFFLLSYTEQYF